MSTANTEIRIRTKCDKCALGRVENPAWRAHDKRFQHRDSTSFTEYMDWWKAAGFTEIPPRFTRCDTCDGGGYVHGWMMASELTAGEKR